MNRGSVVKKRLSKNVLEMKFMKRTKEKTERELENEERQAMFAHEISDAMRSQGERFVTEPSFAAIENLMFGHRAYLGMNPEIEKITQEEEQADEDAEAAKNEVSVSEQEMADHYASTAGSTIAKKIATKRSFPGLIAPRHLIPANDVEGEKLLERGAALMNQSKNMNRVWTKEGQSNKKRKFIKPAEID